MLASLRFHSKLFTKTTVFQKLINYFYTVASNNYSNIINPNTGEVEMMEIKTEPNQSDKLYSDGEIYKMVDNNSMECVTGSKIHMSFIYI